MNDVENYIKDILKERKIHLGFDQKRAQGLRLLVDVRCRQVVVAFQSRFHLVSVVVKVFVHLNRLPPYFVGDFFRTLHKREENTETTSCGVGFHTDLARFERFFEAVDPSFVSLDGSSCHLYEIRWRHDFDQAQHGDGLGCVFRARLCGGLQVLCRDDQFPQLSLDGGEDLFRLRGFRRDGFRSGGKKL